MKKHGQKTEEPISNHFDRKKERAKPSPFFTDVNEISDFLNLEAQKKESLKVVCSVYPLKIPKFYASLFEKENPLCPLKKQAIPSIEEIQSSSNPDILNEKSISLTPILLRRYKNRAVFLAGQDCAIYCRFCNRKRFFVDGFNPFPYFEETFKLIEKEREIREIILSGNDPFMLPHEIVLEILSRLRKMEHVKIIRISSRVPLVFPEGLHSAHFKIIRAFSPIWIIVHINHPKEITKEFKKHVENFRRSGCILLSQTVLLKGVNDCPYVLIKLFQELVMLGVKPYYLFQLDYVKGTEHFKVNLGRGLEIMKKLRQEASGLAIPQYVVDIPGGLGKIPIETGYVKRKKGKKITLLSASGKKGVYLDTLYENTCSGCGSCRDFE